VNVVLPDGDDRSALVLDLEFGRSSFTEKEQCAILCRDVTGIMKGDVANDGFGPAEKVLKVVVCVGEADLDIAKLNGKYKGRVAFVAWRPSVKAHEFREEFRRAIWQLWTDKNKPQ
jgi:hypothetical protein